MTTLNLIHESISQFQPLQVPVYGAQKIKFQPQKVLIKTGSFTRVSTVSEIQA